MKSKYFDERQLQIRGEIFFHGLVTAIALLLVNAFLLGNNIVWASGFHQNILIIMLTGTVVIIEAIFRDAFFGMGQMRWPIIGAFGVISLVLLFFCVSRIIQGAALIENGELTVNGYLSFYTTMPVSITVAGIIMEINEKKKKCELEAEID